MLDTYPSEFKLLLLWGIARLNSVVYHGEPIHIQIRLWLLGAYGHQYEVYRVLETVKVS